MISAKRMNVISILLVFLLAGTAQSVSLVPPVAVLTTRGGSRSAGKRTTVEPASPLAQNPLQIFVNTIKESKKHLVAAGVARCVSIFSMFPVDTIKTRLQMGQSNAFSLDGLYKGVGGSLFGQVPYGVLTFGSYEMYKKTFLERFPNVKPAFVYALAAICGDITGSGWLCPSEVVKQQTQAGMYASTGDAVRGIFQKKGLAGFYQGYMGGLTRDVPFRVAQLVSFEITKNFYLRSKKKSSPHQEEKVNLSAVESAICGAIAGSVSAAITSPLDRIKTLLMTDSVAYGGTVGSCISKIWRDEGMAGLFQGMAPRVVYIAPSVAIFFIAYEQVQQRMSE